MIQRLLVAARVGASFVLAGLALALGLITLNQSTVARAAVVAGPVSGLQIIQSDENRLVLELNIPTYDLNNTALAQQRFQHLLIDGATALAVPGNPELPKFSTLIGIPAQGRVTVQVIQDDLQPLSGHYQLLPSPAPAPIAGDLQPGTMQRVPDRAAYASTTLYPVDVARVVETAWLRDQHLARLEIYPFQYRASTGTLLWHRHLRIEVRFAGGSPTDRAAASTGEGPFEPMLQQDVLNYEVARRWRSNEAAPRVTSRPLTATSRYKIVVDHDGLYRVTYDDLLAAGLVLTSVDPRNLQMTNQGLAVALEVVGEGDGQFNPEDYLLFYGQRLRGDLLASKFISESAHWPALGLLNWQPHFNAKMVEKYTDDNVYWLEVGSTPGLRMTVLNGTVTGAPVADYYTATVHAEESTLWRTNTFTGEDPFFWDSVTASSVPVTRTYPVTLSAVADTVLPATVRGEVVAWTYSGPITPDHRTRFYLNNMVTPLEDQSWDGPARHYFAGQVPAAVLTQGANSLKFVVMLQPGMVADTMFFDWFEVSYPRRFQAEAGQLTFHSERAGATQYQVTQLTTNTLVTLDVSNPWRPQHVLSPSVAGASGVFTASFELNSSVPVTMVVSDRSAWQTPKAITLYAPTDDLKAPSNGADYIMITPQVFYTSTQTLAAYRAAQGLRVKVVKLEDVIDQFTDGIYHSIAIKAFLQYAYQNWQRPAPTYVLLVGDGHWNFKGYSVSTNQGPAGPSPIYMPPHLVWVDPWQGEVDSSTALAAVSGDDILPDLLIGRMPVNSAAELDVIISKTIAYEQIKGQPWQRRLTFIADNTPDASGDFLALSENAINQYAPPVLAIDRLYLDDYCTTPLPINPCPTMNYAITKSLNLTGSLLVNYVGHASTNRWAHEQILVNADVPTLNNLTQLPVILSLTCLDGYWFHPITATQASLMETLLRAPNGGDVASFSPTGLGIATGHDALQRGFYRSWFVRDEPHLGMAALAAKLELYAAGHDYDLIDTFTIFGDPALRLPILNRLRLPLVQKN